MNKIIKTILVSTTTLVLVAPAAALAVDKVNTKTEIRACTATYAAAVKSANTIYISAIKAAEAKYKAAVAAALKERNSAKSTALTAFKTVKNQVLDTEKACLKNANSKAKEVAVAANCDAFPDKLKSCLKYKCQFASPLNGAVMQKEIVGMIKGRCNYVEQMPNGGKLECNYTESARKAVAQYYKDVAAAAAAGTSAEIDLGTGEQKTIYTIDGKKVNNPLQEATNNGSCVVSGY